MVLGGLTHGLAPAHVLAGHAPKDDLQAHREDRQQGLGFRERSKICPGPELGAVSFTVSFLVGRVPLLRWTTEKKKYPESNLSTGPSITKGSMDSSQMVVQFSLQEKRHPYQSGPSKHWCNMRQLTWSPTTSPYTWWASG